MSAHDTEETTASPSSASADPPPVSPARPSWEAAPARRPDAAPRPSPRPAPAAPAEAPRPYYAAAPRPTPAPPLPVASYQEEAVQYDLAGNPIAPKPIPAVAPAHPSPGGSPYTPPVPSGYSAGAASSWPPPVGGSAPGGSRNTSGEGGEVPPEVARLTWNWGAFFFPVMWCRKHGLNTEASVLRYSFLALVVLRIALHGISPIAFVVLGALYGTAYSGARIYFAWKGHQMGWRSRHFPGGVPEYFQVQKAWMWWGFGVSAVWTVVLPVMIFLGVLGAGLSMPRNGGNHSSYGSSYSRPTGSWPNTGNTTPGSAPAAP